MEALLEARQRLGCQADLGHQHQRLASLAQYLRYGAQINLGLAGPGIAVQQVGVIAMQLDGREGVRLLEDREVFGKVIIKPGLDA